VDDGGGVVGSSGVWQVMVEMYLNLNILDWQTHNNAIFGTKSFLNTFPIVLISAINHLAV